MSIRLKLEFRMLPGQQQKQMPVGEGHFRCPRGLPFPPLPGDDMDSENIGSFVLRQSGSRSGLPDLIGGRTHGYGSSRSFFG